MHFHECSDCLTCEITVLAIKNLLVNMKYSGLSNFSVNSLKKTLFSKHNQEFTNAYGCAIENFELILEIIHNESQKDLENNCITAKCLTHKYFSFVFHEEL